MNIKSVQFIKSAAHIKQRPPLALPEVAIAGRSNVGKSSLINTLFNRKNLAKISSTPGKTRLINYFQIDKHLYFVDLPGYGYARLSKQAREKWRNSLESYLKDNTYLKLVLLLIDARRGIQPLDRTMIDWLKHYQIPFVVILTKSDKISKNQLNVILTTVSEELPDISVSTFSSLKKSGREEVIALLQDIAELNPLHSHKPSTARI